MQATAETTTPTTPTKGKTPSPSKPTVAVVIYGRDKKHKAHAAAFTAADAEAAKTAAGIMGYRVWQVPEVGRPLAAKIAKGVLFGSGRARASLVSRKLMAELELLAGPAPKPGKVAAPAAEPAPKAAGEAASGPGGAGGGTPNSPAAKPANAPRTRPADWTSIGTGCEVLATTGGKADGWFEAVITGLRDADLFELKWVDYPDDPSFVRRRDNLGLLPPKPVA